MDVQKPGKSPPHRPVFPGRATRAILRHYKSKSQFAAGSTQLDALTLVALFDPLPGQKMASCGGPKFGADHAALDDAVSDCSACHPLHCRSRRPHRQGSGATCRQPIAAGASSRELQIQDDGGPACAVPFRAVLV
jgi:hypothetical protein